VLGIVDAFARPHRCRCDCHAALTVEERTQGVAAMFRFDDAIRGWGYEPIYEPAADGLYRAAQKRNDASYRGIAVRDEACLYRRFVGFAVHELIHALHGDVSKANYGIPFGLPYGVPAELPEGEEPAYLHPFNQAEARAWVGVAPLARALFGIEWTLRTARDVGTYGFAGGNAIVDVPPGFRPVPHVDRHHHPQRYYALAARLEEEAAAWFTAERLRELCARVNDAEERGRLLRRKKYPAPVELARLEPAPLGRNDICVCGSGKKFKKCCGANA
jgi:SEC-C motif